MERVAAAVIISRQDQSHVLRYVVVLTLRLFQRTRAGLGKPRPSFDGDCQNGAVSDEAGAWSEAVEPEAFTSGSGSPRSSLRTTSARMHQNVCLLVLAFLPLPFPRSYVVLTRLPSTSTCEPFLIVVATYSDSRERK